MEQILMTPQYSLHKSRSFGGGSVYFQVNANVYFSSTEGKEKREHERCHRLVEMRP